MQKTFFSWDIDQLKTTLINKTFEEVSYVGGSSNQRKVSRTLVITDLQFNSSNGTITLISNNNPFYPLYRLQYDQWLETGNFRGNTFLDDSIYKIF